MKSLLFNDYLSPLVKAGTKTTTRRFARSSQGDCGEYLPCDDGTFAQRINGYESIYDNPLKPKYYIGEKVYLLEAFKIVSFDDNAQQLYFKFKDDTYKFIDFETKERYEKFKKFFGRNGWQSPYFLPVEAGRYFYEITDVKVDLLNNMKFSDFLNEGINEFPENGKSYFAVSREWWVKKRKNKSLPDTPKEAFKILWNDTVPKTKPEGLWENNPYVFVYTFRRCDL